MQYARLGKTGLNVSRICLGMMTYGSKKWREWALEGDEGLPFVQKALDSGINFFDTADVYSWGVSEEILGRALKIYAKREEVIVATKVYSEMGPGPNQRGLSRKHILDSIDASLTRLQTDYVDLYQIHRFDYNTPIEESLDALDACVRSGKVRYLGASSMYAWQFMKMLETAKAMRLHQFVSMQPQYNLIYREEEREMLPLCVEEGIGVIPWSPLARGYLTRPAEVTTLRKENDPFGKGLYDEPSDAEIISVTNEIAKERGVPPAHVALAWVLAKPSIVSPIIGASKAHHLEDAIAAADLTLSPEEVGRLEAPYKPHRIKDHS